MAWIFVYLKKCKNKKIFVFQFYSTLISRNRSTNRSANNQFDNKYPPI